MKSNIPIDSIYNVFGVFSRMNMSQVAEGIISKSVMMTERLLKSTGDITHLQHLIDNVLQYVDQQYSDRVQQFYESMKLNHSLKDRFIEDINKRGLYIECPTFGKININALNKYSTPVCEDVFVSNKLLKYMKQKLKIEVPTEQDVTLKNIFCAPIYTMKLYKIANKLISARDFGPYVLIIRLKRVSVIVRSMLVIYY